MTDRTIEQINHNLDQVLAISAENTRNIAENSRAIDELRVYVAQVAGTVERIALATDQNLKKQDAWIARQDQLIQLLSTYITGVAPDNEDS